MQATTSKKKKMNRSDTFGENLEKIEMAQLGGHNETFDDIHSHQIEDSKEKIKLSYNLVAAFE